MPGLLYDAVVAEGTRRLVGAFFYYSECRHRHNYQQLAHSVALGRNQHKHLAHGQGLLGNCCSGSRRDGRVVCKEEDTRGD